MDKLEPCPFCKDAWLYVSDGGYTSDYEHKGFRVNCQCGYAWKVVKWCRSKEEAIEAWNGEEKHNG